MDFTGRRCLVSGQRGEQGGLAGAIGAEYCPVFAGLNSPVEAIEDMCVIPFEAKANDVKDGWFWHVGLVTGPASVAKRKFPLPVRNTLIGLA